MGAFYLFVGFSANATVIDFHPLDRSPQKTVVVSFRIQEEVKATPFGKPIYFRLPNEERPMTVTFIPYSTPAAQFPKRVALISRDLEHPVIYTPKGPPVDLEKLTTAALLNTPLPSSLNLSESSTIISEEEKEKIGTRTATLAVEPSNLIDELRLAMTSIQRSARLRILKKNPDLVRWISTLLRGETPQNLNVRTCENAIRMLASISNSEIQKNPRPGISFRTTFPRGNSVEILTRHKNFKNRRRYMKYLERSIRTFLQQAGFQLDGEGNICVEADPRDM